MAISQIRQANEKKQPNVRSGQSGHSPRNASMTALRCGAAVYAILPIGRFRPIAKYRQVVGRRCEVTPPLNDPKSAIQKAY